MPLPHVLAFLQNGRLHRPDLPKSWPDSEDVRGRQRETTFLVNLAVFLFVPATPLLGGKEYLGHLSR